MDITRRQFLQSMAATGLTPSLMNWPTSLRAAPMKTATTEPHYVLFLHLTGGFDHSYLFDARPLEMTEKGLQVNYHGEAPQMLTGKNGGTTLYSPLAKPLLPYWPKMAIFNGVMMSDSFDGHLENENFYFGTNPFGGQGILPLFNRYGRQTKSLLDAFNIGKSIDGRIENFDRTLPINYTIGQQIQSQVKTPEKIDNSNGDFAKFHQEQLDRIAESDQGRFFLGAQKIAGGEQLSNQISQRFGQLDLSNAPMQPLGRNIFFVLESFRKQLINVGLIEIAVGGENLFLDTHDSESAARTPAMTQTLVQNIVTVFKALEESPFDGQRSMLDMTTVVIASEFTRTMRQLNNPIDKTGTDHNPFTNTVILAGKGISGEQIFGASDFETSDEVLSPAHLIKDPMKLRLMAKPFDFKTQKVRLDLPAQFVASDYLSIANVQNTLLSALGVSQEHQRKDSNDQVATTMTQALI